MGQKPSRPGPSRRVRVGTAVAAGLLVAALIAGVGIQATDDDTPTTTVPANLTAEGRHLLDLLAQRDRQTYHARYTGSAPQTSSITLESWQKPPRVRQDSQVSVQGQVAHTSAFVLEEGAVRCTQLGQAPWTCARTDSVASADPLSTIRSRLGQGSVEARDTTVSGRPVRCFRFTAEGAANELCVIPDRGIPVTVRAGDSRLDLAALDEDVPPEAFKPPAPITG
jgi:hypothetical protein